MSILPLARLEAHSHRFDRPDIVTMAATGDDRPRCRHCGRPKLKEAEFRRQVVDLADAFGWEHVGWRPAQTKWGWRTPGTGTMAAGWPDLVLVHPRVGRIVFVELKGDGGKLDPDQVRVLEVLRHVRCAEVHVWGPDDLEQAQAVLAP